MDNIRIPVVIYHMCILIRFVNGKGFELSSETVSWKEAHSRCKTFGQLFRNISHDDAYVNVTLHRPAPIPLRTSSRQPAVELRQPEEFWIGGYEILTPWIISIGCYEDTQNKESIRKETTFSNNQAKRCAVFCGSNMFFTLQLEKCQCRVTLKSLNGSRPRKQCKNSCPGNVMEKCADKLTHIVYRKVFETTSDEGMCMSGRVEKGKWEKQSRNCTDELKYLYKDSGGNLVGSNETLDWFGARVKTELKGDIFSDENMIPHTYRKKDNIADGEDYWIAIFRNKTIVWDDKYPESNTMRTGRCVALRESTYDRSKLVYYDCGKKLKYMCDSDNLHNSHIIGINDVGGNAVADNDVNDDDATGSISTVPITTSIFMEKTTLSEHTTQNSKENVSTVTDTAVSEKQGFMEDIYKYVVVGVGSALVVCFVFGCILIVRRCLHKKPSENKGELTSTTELSTGNDPPLASSSMKAKPEEHIYDEIADPPVCDIKINNYSEPLPLKDTHMQNNFRMEYAEPYDTLKNRHGKLNIKLMNKNDRSNLTKKSNTSGPNKNEPYYSEFNIATISNGLLKFAQKDMDVISNGNLSAVDVKNNKDSKGSTVSHYS